MKVMLWLIAPAVILEMLLYFLALGFETHSCSESAAKLVTVGCLAVPPVSYLLIDSRVTRGRLGAVMRTFVVTVISLLPIAIFAPGMYRAPQESKRKTTMQRMQQIANELEAFDTAHNRHPAAHNIAGLRNALRKDIPADDSWCRAFLIESSERHYAIVSYGRDGRPGGGDFYHRYDEDLVFRDGSFQPLKY
jgi:hypothetical protein